MISSMSIIWQEAATVVILSLAAGYVVHRVVRFVRRKGMPDCHGCPNCPAERRENPLVVLKNRTGRSERNGH
jgi:hypothetical protein